MQWSLMRDELSVDGWRAFRSLARSPEFTLVVVLVIGLGIGATTAIFSIVNAVLIRPLPFRDPDRLVMLFETAKGAPIPRFPVSPPDLLDFSAISSPSMGSAPIRTSSSNSAAPAPPNASSARA